MNCAPEKYVGYDTPVASSTLAITTTLHSTGLAQAGWFNRV
jgi:hypothetical protein